MISQFHYGDKQFGNSYVRVCVVSNCTMGLFFGSLLLLAITKMSRNLGQNSPPQNPIVQFGTTPTQSNAQLQNGETGVTIQMKPLF